jgi:hypothetical protein
MKKIKEWFYWNYRKDFLVKFYDNSGEEKREIMCVPRQGHARAEKFFNSACPALSLSYGMRNLSGGVYDASTGKHVLAGRKTKIW